MTGNLILGSPSFAVWILLLATAAVVSSATATATVVVVVTAAAEQEDKDDYPSTAVTTKTIITHINKTSFLSFITYYADIKLCVTKK